MTRQERDGLNMTLIAITCALLMLLPFVTTFDDLLTSWALALGANNPLQGIVPVEARMVVGLLGTASGGRASSCWGSASFQASAETSHQKRVFRLCSSALRAPCF